MFQIYIGLIFSIGLLIYGIKDLNKSKNKNKNFYSGISNLITGLLGIIASIFYFILGESLYIVFFFSLMFLFSGSFGIIYRIKIKNPLTFRMDVFALIIGIMLIIFMLVGI